MLPANSAWPSSAAGRVKKADAEAQGREVRTARRAASPHPHVLRPSVRTSDRGYFIRRPGRSDGRTCGRHRGTGAAIHDGGTLAADARTVRTLVKHGGRWRRRATEKLSLVRFSSSLPLSLSETSVPSERPVATPTSCAATTRSPTENDKRPAREGVRLVGGRLLKVICSARVRVDVREGAPESRRSALLTAAPHLPFEPRKAPSTPHFTADA
jgi:hypothetical protein